MIYTEAHWNTLTRSPRFKFLFELAMLIANAQSQGKAPRGEREWDKISKDFKSIYGRAKHLFCDVRALRDPEHVEFIKNFKMDLWKVHQDLDQHDRLVEVAKKWISNHLHIGDHLSLLSMPSTRNAVIEFLQKNKGRKVRIHQEEYWNKTHLKHYKVDAEYFSDPDDINYNDCIIISVPLHGTYETPKWIYELFKKCSAINVPILVDVCWAWFQHDFFLNLSYPCIDTVTCTLGKMFPIEGFRQAFKFCKTKDISKYDTMYGTNRFGNELLIGLMERFPANDIVEKYKDKQTYWCDILGLEKTNSVHNAKSGDDLLWYAEHKHLVEDGVNQKLFNFVPLFENHDLVVSYLNETGNMFNKQS